MSDFRFSCPKCSKDILCDTSYAGSQINCPVCQQSIVVPRPGAKSAPAVGTGGGSGGMKKVLMVTVIIVVLGALGAGGWYFYSKHKKAVEAAAGNPAAQVSTPTAASAAGAMDLLTKMHDAYSGLQTLSAQGTAVMSIDMSGVTAADMNPNTKNKAAANKRAANMPKSMTYNMDVSMKLAKPDQYLIQGNMKMAAGPMTMTNTTATWSSGKTNYALMLMNGGSFKNYTTVKDRNQAFMMNGQAGGLAMGIPELFFDETGMLTKLITEWGQGSDESVDGQDCYTATGKMLGQKLKLWVSKANYLIVKSEITLGGAISDADIDTVMAMSNTTGKMTPAQTAQMKAQAKQAAMMVTKIKGTLTETYGTYETNNTFTAGDFDYPIPRGVHLVQTGM